MKDATIFGVVSLVCITLFMIIILSLYLASHQERWVPIGTAIPASNFEIVKASCDVPNHFEIQIKNTGNHIIRSRSLQWCLKRYAYQREVCYHVYPPIQPNETLEIKSSVSPPSKYFRVTLESMESNPLIKEYETLVTCEDE